MKCGSNRLTTSTISAARKPATVLDGALRPALYIPSLQSKRKGPVLEELAQALVIGGVTRHPEVVLDLLFQREALGSTGVGKGVAIPHARSTLIAERAILVARSVRGIDFDAADEMPVHLFFLIVAPPAERDPVYLQLLAEIVRAVRLVKVRQRLLAAPDFTTIRETLLHAAAD